ncbi:MULTISPECIES: S-layer homology domain-containing protein [Bacillus]|uniref:S-layer homology domain-containing protein n=1 Tax=Bacillus TaxID=1386 RepID=UPI0002E3193D|nr:MULTISPECIES: S-layer homology domain-containing protein [Bacillus]
MKKLLVLAVLMFSCFFSFTQNTDASGSFKDIENHWAKEEMEYLIGKGVIGGYADGTFKPNEFITRAQAAIMIGRSKELPGEPVDTKFKDVKASVAGSGYIHALTERDIIVGYPDGTYRPHQAVTRGDASIHIDRSSRFENKTGIKNPFNDVSLEMMAYPHIMNLTGNGIASGFADGTFRPNQPITRAQFSVFMARAIQYGR